mmetsp:Transcript_39312/g.127804  ORF Transcript_39312/g.127804 Transcript_39312/m.127804 type:complete len:1008 (+) Transcript_39312:115-3138(+)
MAAHPRPPGHPSHGRAAPPPEHELSRRPALRDGARPRASPPPSAAPSPAGRGRGALLDERVREHREGGRAVVWRVEPRQRDLRVELVVDEVLRGLGHHLLEAAAVVLGIEHVHEQQPAHLHAARRLLRLRVRPRARGRGAHALASLAHRSAVLGLRPARRLAERDLAAMHVRGERQGAALEALPVDVAVAVDVHARELLDSIRQLRQPAGRLLALPRPLGGAHRLLEGCSPATHLSSKRLPVGALKGARVENEERQDPPAANARGTARGSLDGDAAGDRRGELRRDEARARVVSRVEERQARPRPQPRRRLELLVQVQVARLALHLLGRRARRHRPRGGPPRRLCRRRLGSLQLAARASADPRLSGKSRRLAGHPGYLTPSARLLARLRDRLAAAGGQHDGDDLLERHQLEDLGAEPRHHRPAAEEVRAALVGALIAQLLERRASVVLVRLVHDDDRLAQPAGGRVLDLARLGREVAAREEEEHHVRGGDVVGERAELLEVVDVKEDLHLRRERGEPPLDHVHLVLAAAPRVREKEVVLAARLGAQARRLAGGAPHQLAAPLGELEAPGDQEESERQEGDDSRRREDGGEEHSAQVLVLFLGRVFAINAAVPARADAHASHIALAVARALDLLDICPPVLDVPNARPLRRPERRTPPEEAAAALRPWRRREGEHGVGGGACLGRPHDHLRVAAVRRRGGAVGRLQHEHPDGDLPIGVEGDVSVELAQRARRQLLRDRLGLERAGGLNGGDQRGDAPKGRGAVVGDLRLVVPRGVSRGEVGGGHAAEVAHGGHGAVPRRWSEGVLSLPPAVARRGGERGGTDRGGDGEGERRPVEPLERRDDRLGRAQVGAADEHVDPSVAELPQCVVDLVRICRRLRNRDDQRDARAIPCHLEAVLRAQRLAVRALRLGEERVRLDEADAQAREAATAAGEARRLRVSGGARGGLIRVDVRRRRSDGGERVVVVDGSGRIEAEGEVVLREDGGAGRAGRDHQQTVGKALLRSVLRER